jgi:ubiquitin-like 1-activating enzyme E1 B
MSSLCLFQILKNLALLGIKNIDLIDLDTIDVSNLNRQFLFRPEHVGHSKAEIAAKAAKTFNPDMNVKAFHDNVKNNSKFNVHYFSSFDVVLNALDNIDARRHVNRLCLAAGIPLFDSGTTGYLGQVTPIIKGFTSCYECYPKPTPKVYPICTIRSTPDKPVHCIVWAKECLKLIFGNTSESMLFEDESTGEISEYMHLLKFPEGYHLNQEMYLAFVEKLIIGLFQKEIQKRIDMDVYKTAAKKPVPLDTDLIHHAVQKVKQQISGKKEELLSLSTTSKKGWDQTVWNIGDSLIEFILSFFHLLKEGSEEHGITLLGQLSFDKDDLWSMKFVTAASNLRSFIFSIPLLSFHDAKGIAGNIIPAIATTNAIVAGVQVMQLIKFVLHFSKEELFPKETTLSEEEKAGIQERLVKYFPQTYCIRFPTRKGFYLQPSTPDEPVETCYVCRKSQLTLQVSPFPNFFRFEFVICFSVYRLTQRKRH